MTDLPAAFIHQIESAIFAREGYKSGVHLRFICPAHDDHDPSADWHPGKQTWKCRSCEAGGGAIDLAKRLGIPLPERPIEAKPAARQIVAEYSYTDEGGNVLYQAIRYNPKGFAQRRPDGNGGWIWNVAEVRRVPYNLPGLLVGNDEPWNQPTVYICEGEKDADRLISLGCVATTNVGGAGKWTEELAVYLVDRKVVILPDNDEAGRKHAQQVKAMLEGITKSVLILELPGLREKGDVSDWLGMGHTKDDLDRIVHDAEIAEAAGRLQLLTPAELKVLPKPRWIIEDMLVEDSVACIVGPPGTLKSFVALSMHLAIAAGEDWHGRLTVAGSSLYVVAEGVRGMSSRLEAWERYHRKPAPERARFVAEPLQLANGATDRLLDAIQYWGEAPRLIVVDTLARTAVGLEENSAKDMGEYIAAAERLRRETGACVLFIHHSTRAAGNPRGSSALDGAFDTLISVARESDVISLRCSKQKDAGEFHQFRLIPQVIPLEAGESSVVLIPSMMGEDINRSARDAYRVLIDTFGEMGATVTEWWKAVRETGKMAEPTFYRARKALVDGGRVTTDGAGRGARYRPAGQARLLSPAD